jgi:hypothetical protein
MRNALIFHAVIICATSVLVFALKGKQTRRERDEKEARLAESDQTVVRTPTRRDGVDQSKEA